jgi:hypothetical protein
MEGTMQHNVIAIRTWNRAFDGTTDLTSLECACLFSVFGLAVSVAVMLISTPETIAAMTAGFM